MKFDPRLYLLTNGKINDIDFFVITLGEALKGGCTLFQLREKHLSNRDFLEIIKRIEPILETYSIPYVINDRVELVEKSNAIGIHLGQSDMDVQKARELLGPKKIIGLSIENLEQAKRANMLDIDYIAASPVFFTSTKKNLKKPLGLEILNKIVNVSKHPVIAIGGMKIENIAEVLEKGVKGIAAVSSILSAENPCESAKKMKCIIEKYLR